MEEVEQGDYEQITSFPSEILAVKHESMILGHSSNPVYGFSMMEQVRLCAVWLGSSLNQIQGWTTVRESYSPALEQRPLLSFLHPPPSPPIPTLSLFSAFPSFISFSSFLVAKKRRKRSLSALFLTNWNSSCRPCAFSSPIILTVRVLTERTTRCQNKMSGQ